MTTIQHIIDSLAALALALNDNPVAALVVVALGGYAFSGYVIHVYRRQ